MSLCKLSFAVVLCFASQGNVAAREPIPSPIVLPPVIHAVAGTPAQIVFRNSVLIPPGEKFVFPELSVPFGTLNESKEIWNFIPTENQIGDHEWTIKSGGAEAKTVIRVIAENAGKDRTISLLIIGDSLTHASAYPNEIARLLTLPGNPKWEMLGTHHPAGAGEKVFHEGYGGWTWNRFNTQWKPDEPEDGKLKSSPFLFLENDKPTLDFRRYFEERCGGKKPDFVTFLLGINDCFHVSPDDPAAIDAKIDFMVTEAEILLSALRKASPETEVGICLTPPANDRDGAFVANYKDKYTRWGWRRIQFRLVQRQLEHFGNRESENLFIIPTSIGIDPLTGYPDNNGVHPNTEGYHTIGREIYAWLKWRLAVNP